MAIPWTVVEPAETAPSSEGGVNNLIEGIVLVRHGERRLVYRRPSTYGSGGYPHYVPAHTDVMEWVPGWGCMGRKVFEGRFGVCRLLEHQEKIRTLLLLPEGFSITELLSTVKKQWTLVIRNEG